jgi:hypothetical protein
MIGDLLTVVGQPKPHDRGPAAAFPTTPSFMIGALLPLRRPARAS